MAPPFTILNVSGPYREPHAPVFSYDYAVQRPSWPTPHSVRVKVAIAEELNHLKTAVLGLSGGSPGQQLRMTQMLTRRIADRKIQIANDEGMFAERFDVMIEPFIGPMAHLFAPLETWMQEAKASLRQEIHEKIGI
ncbi:MAG: hypothetical protein FJ246_09775 [Nitrospira sp.]|nr:hypothetical protein [Nitrospira sp.]